MATTDEMCLSYLNYYPRSAFDVCLSFPNEQTTATFLTGLSTSKQGELAVLAGQYGNDTKAIINNFVWDIDSLEALEVAYKTEYAPFCYPMPEKAVCDSFNLDSGARVTREILFFVFISSLAALFINQITL